MARNKYPEDKKNSPFASALRNLMLEKGATQEDLAKVTNKTRQTVSQYTNGISEPGYDTLVKIADYFHVSTDYLLGRTKDPSRQPCAADKLGLEQVHIDILSLVTEINNSEGHYGTNGSYVLSEKMKQLLPILKANRFLEEYSRENVGIDKPGDESANALATIVFSRLFLQFIGDMMNAVQQNGNILRDYDSVCTNGAIPESQPSNSTKLDALSAGYELIPYQDYIRFKSCEIAKHIDRYLMQRYLNGND